MFRYGLVLSVICLAASSLLAGASSLTKARILAQAQSEEDSGLKEVMPQADSFAPVRQQSEVLYYRALDRNKKLVGVVFKATGKGYSSNIETLSGMLTDGTISAIKVLSQNETPGLGAQVAEKKFCAGFSQKNITDLSSVQAITGATISSQAVINSVKKKAAEIKGLIHDEK
jgi:electron transport complex protein RnfG